MTKTLKLDHELAELVSQGKKTSTWRIFDDKQLSVGDKINFVDKVDPNDKSTWVTFGKAEIQQVTEKMIKDITPADHEGHETIGSPQEVLARYRSYYGDGIAETTPLKIVKFKLIDDKKYDEPNSRIEQAKLYADGGSRGNPGPSAGGYVILDMADTVVKSNGKYLGITTNNQAEYHSLKGGIEMAVTMGIKELHVYMDSLLVVNQMKGIYKIRNRDLWPIHDSIKQLLPKFDKVTFTHVPRELNKLADAEVNQALDAQKNV